MAHNAPPPGETLETRLAQGLESIKEHKEHMNLGNFAMHLAIGDEGTQQLMSALSACSSEELATTKITLYGNHIGPAGAAAVADVVQDRPGLRLINLQTNAIGAEGAQSLATALTSDTCGVTKLCLGWTNIGDEVATAVAKALIKNRTVTHINIPSSGISDKGAAWFAEALRDNHTVTRLDLDNNSVSEWVLKQLREATLINQKRIKAPWSHRTNRIFPKSFKLQVMTLVMLGEWKSGACSQYFANMPHDINVLLNQTMYDMHWHQGDKYQALEGVLSLLDVQEMAKEKEKMLTTNRRATRSSTRKGKTS